MERHKLFELAMLLLFGFAGGLLFYGRRGFLPDREARKRGVFLAGGILCVVVCLLRVYQPVSLHTVEVRTSSPGIETWTYHYGPLWPRLVVLLLPLAVLILAAALLRWKERLLARSAAGKRMYQVMWRLCAGGFVVLYAFETYPILREMFPG